MMKKAAKAIASEREIKKTISEYLTLKGIFHWVVNTGAARMMNKGGHGKPRFVRFGFPGVSDILGILPLHTIGASSRGLFALNSATVGRFLAIEVKRPGKKPTLDQQAFLAAVESNGGLAIVATSVEDVKNALGI